MTFGMRAMRFLCVSGEWFKDIGTSWLGVLLVMTLQQQAQSHNPPRETFLSRDVDP